MIEVEVVRRMVHRGAVLAGIAVVAVAIFADRDAAVAATVGSLLALGNLYLAGRVIGGIAENAPHLLVAGALAAFGLGMILLAAVGLLLRNIEGFRGTYAAIALVTLHLVVVSWEAADRLLKMPAGSESVSRSSSTGVDA